MGDLFSAAADGREKFDETHFFAYSLVYFLIRNLILILIMSLTLVFINLRLSTTCKQNVKKGVPNLNRLQS